MVDIYLLFIHELFEFFEPGWDVRIHPDRSVEEIRSDGIRLECRVGALQFCPGEVFLGNEMLNGGHAGVFGDGALADVSVTKIR